MSFLLIILVFVLFGIVIINGLFTLGRLTRTIYEHPLVVSNASLTAALNMTKMHRSMKDVVLATTTAEMEAALKEVSKSEDAVYQQLDTIREKILGQEGQNLEVQTRRLFENWQPIRDEVVHLFGAGGRAAAISITQGKGAGHVAALEGKMLELTSYARRKATGFLANALESQSRLEQITVGLTVIGIVLSVLIAAFATQRVLRSEKVLQDEKQKLQEALDEIKTLRGIIPICAHCKQIRDDAGMWNRIEEYIHAHSEAEFSHSICPRCAKRFYPEVLDDLSGDDER